MILPLEITEGLHSDKSGKSVHNACSKDQEEC